MRKCLLLLCALLFLFSACNKGTPPTTDLLSDLLSLPGVTRPDADIYFAQGEPEMRLDQIMLPLYGVEQKTLARLADYAVLLGRSTTLYEIHILRALSPSDVPALRRMLETRAKLLCLATEEGHPTERNAIVCENGCLLFLFATPHNRIFEQSALS